MELTNHAVSFSKLGNREIEMSAVDVNQKNFCTDLNLTSKLITPGRCLMWAPLTDPIRSPRNACRVGVMATMVDVAGSDPVLAAWSPDWTATQDLSVHSVAPLLQGPIVVDTRLLRLGKKVIFVSAEIYDGHGIDDLEQLQALIDTFHPEHSDLSLTARSLATFVRIPRTGASGVDQYDPNKWLGAIRKRTAQQENQQALNHRIGLKIVDPAAGVVELTNTPYVANSIGTINGGVQALMLESAAEAMCPGRIATDIQIHFLSQLKSGPARSVATLIRDAADHSVVLIQLLDAGASDKLIATATVTLM